MKPLLHIRHKVSSSVLCKTKKIRTNPTTLHTIGWVGDGAWGQGEMSQAVHFEISSFPQSLVPPAPFHFYFILLGGGRQSFAL